MTELFVGDVILLKEQCTWLAVGDEAISNLSTVPFKLKKDSFVSRELQSQTTEFLFSFFHCLHACSV